MAWRSRRPLVFRRPDRTPGSPFNNLVRLPRLFLRRKETTPNHGVVPLITSEPSGPCAHRLGLACSSWPPDILAHFLGSKGSLVLVRWAEWTLWGRDLQEGMANCLVRSQKSLLISPPGTNFCLHLLLYVTTLQKEILHLECLGN